MSAYDVRLRALAALLVGAWSEHTPWLWRVRAMLVMSACDAVGLVLASGSGSESLVGEDDLRAMREHLARVRDGSRELGETLARGVLVEGMTVHGSSNTEADALAQAVLLVSGAILTRISGRAIVRDGVPWSPDLIERWREHHGRIFEGVA